MHRELRVVVQVYRSRDRSATMRPRGASCHARANIEAIFVRYGKHVKNANPSYMYWQSLSLCEWEQKSELSIEIW